VSAASRLQSAWSGRGALSTLLLPVAWLYGAIVALRRGLFREGWLSSERMTVPVVVVGNLIAGGAGKTPTTMAVVALLRRRGFHPGIVSRGYGRKDDTAVVYVQPDTPAHLCGDEPLLLRLRTGAPVVVARDRVRACRELLKRHPSIDVLLADDGLQHLRLQRQAQVIVFDDRGAGNGRLLPAGPLREPVPHGVPARSVVVYNADTASTAWPGHVAVRGLAGVVSLDGWWRGDAANPSALLALQGRAVLAAAGLAQPSRFFDMLVAAGLRITPLPLPDHHDFAALPWPLDSADVVVTEKDAVKLQPPRMGTTRVWVATLDFALPTAFEDELMALLPAPPSPRPTPAT
jgi:tetraacyldisaccharide 4'-kinase